MKKIWLIQFENGRYANWQDFDIFGNDSIQAKDDIPYSCVNSAQVLRRMKQLKQEYSRAGLNPPTMNIVYDYKTR